MSVKLESLLPNTQTLTRFQSVYRFEPHSRTDAFVELSDVNGVVEVFWHVGQHAGTFRKQPVSYGYHSYQG